MKKKIAVLLAVLLLVSLVLASCSGSNGKGPAEEGLPATLTIGSGSMGSTNNTIAVAIASVVTNHADTELKAVATSGSTEYVPMMATKEIDLGVIANYDCLMAYTGQGSFADMSKGKGYDFGILVCGSAQYVLNLVAGDSGINSGADFAGKRYVSEYTGNDSATAMAKALLANHGLTEADVTAVAIESIPNAIAAIIEGRVDVCQSALAVSSLYELDSAKGVKFIGMDDSDAAMARVREIYPGYSVTLTSENSQWITEPVNALAYDNYVIARSTLSDEAAYQITKALYESNEELLTASNATGDWVQENYVSENVAIPYHPGAVKYYKEIGVWTDSMEARQQELIKTLG